MFVALSGNNFSRLISFFSFFFRHCVFQEAFVASLTQFTLLGQTQAKEMKQKNIDAIKILLTIA